MSNDQPAEDIVRAIGSIFGKMDATVRMKQLRARIGDDPRAREGLRKAVVDHMINRFVSNTEAGTSGVGTLKADQLQSFVAQNKSPLLAAGFTENELRIMDSVAADLQQANRSIAAVKFPGGSNTTQDVLAAKASDSGASSLVKIVLASSFSGGGAGFVLGPWAGLATTIGAGLVGVLRQRGLSKVDDLVKEALLDPALARRLLAKGKPRDVSDPDVTVAQRARRGATAAAIATSDDQRRRTTAPVWADGGAQ